MAYDAQEIPRDLDTSIPTSGDSIPTDQRRATDYSAECDGQISNNIEHPTHEPTVDGGPAQYFPTAHYLARICEALEKTYSPLLKTEDKLSAADIQVYRDRWGLSDEIKRLVITSEPLVKLLRDVAEFYPGANLSSNPFVIKRPFSILYHTLPALRERSLEEENDKILAELRDKLLVTCDTALAKLFASCRNAFATGDVFYSALGALFRPGNLLIAVDALNQKRLLMCVGGRFDNKHSNDMEDVRFGSDSAFKVTTWGLAWIPATLCFNRRILEFSIPFFEGSRKIEGLPLYPFETYGNEEARELVRNELIARGQRWCQLVSGKSSYWMHEGLYIQHGRDRLLFTGRYEPPRIRHVRSHTNGVSNINP
jgi:hypothetical protein